MKIVIIGDGKVGHKLTTQLSEENYDVVLIDQNEGKLNETYIEPSPGSAVNAPNCTCFSSLL